MGIENMLKLNDMTMDDIELVEFPYPDDWYDKPEMLVPPMNNRLSYGCAVTTSTTWPSARWKRSPGGAVDAIYTQSKVFSTCRRLPARSR